MSKATLLYKMLNDCSAPNLKELLMRRNSNYDFRNSHTDPGPSQTETRIFLGKLALISTVVLNFGIIFRAKLKKRNQFSLSKTL